MASDILAAHHRNRRSQVFDMSPSSSDNEGDKANALLRVQRRRQSSRRMSCIAAGEGPIFRPLDVLICDDHPVSRMVMEKLLEEVSFEAEDRGGQTLTIDAAYVESQLETIARNTDLSRYVL